MSSKNNPRTIRLQPNDNKTFSVGIPIVVDSHFRKLGFEGVFGPLKSKGVGINPLARLLVTCRKKDSIEIKPARCWKKERQIGVLLIGFLAQLFVSLLRCDLSELASASEKFIKKKPKEFDSNACVGRKRRQEAHFLNIASLIQSRLISVVWKP